jgi:DNA replication protein DnaC
MRNKTDTIVELSEYLGLKKISQQYQEYIQQAHEKELGLLEFLEMILTEEAARKRESTIRYRITESRLPRPYKFSVILNLAFNPNYESR